jgi:hypothetical protein
MRDSIPLVSTVESLTPSNVDPSLNTKTLVKLRGAAGAFIDTTAPARRNWAAVLKSLHQSELPVYLEVGAATREITKLLVPRLVKVAGLVAREEGGSFYVKLIISERLHLLSKSHPSFSANLAKLRRAMKTNTAVLVTEDQNGDQIIDVRPIPKNVTIPGYLAIPRSRKPLKSKAKGGAK